MIEELHNKIINNEIKSLDLASEALKKSHEVQKECNAFVTILDNLEYQENKESLLDKIPYSAKDMFSTKNILTTGSSNSLKDYVPFFDATVIKKLKEAGAILTSKSACDEFGLGFTGTTCHTGIVKNPYDKMRQAGGSSAGSAVAVSAGVVPFSLGTDTGDSVRKPAAYCGIVGFKPTYGVISRYGVFPFAASLDHVAVFANSVKDASIVVDAIKGPDGKDMTALPEMPNFTPQIDGNVNGKKLFYIKEICNIDNYNNPDKDMIETFKIFNETLDKLRSIGVEVVEESIDQRLLNALLPAYQVISCAEATSNLSMYTGIIYGPRGVGTNVFDMLKDYRTKGFSPLIKRRLVIGSYVLQKENQERYYLNACKVRNLVIKTFNKLFEKYDGFITIPSGKGAPLLDESSELLSKLTVLENHLCIGNFGGYPSITIPNGYVNNLPIGVNITGKVMDDANILNIAYALEKEIKFNKNIGGQNE